MSKNLVNAVQAAEKLGVKTSWVRMAVFKKEIPFIKLGRLVRFNLEDLDNYIASNTTGEVRS